MALDLARFHQAFFEESAERADAMEQALLCLDTAPDRAETINLIFRSAHSIKGGAATFGFAAVAGFTHHLETLLDRVRAGQREVDAPLIDLLLRAADVVRALLAAAQGGDAVDDAVVTDVQMQLQQALQGRSPTPVVIASPAVVTEAAAGSEHGLLIRFTPHEDLFATGNDPLRILRELSTLGRLESELHLPTVPRLADADPQSCYASWTLRLYGSATEAQVQDAFAWVEGDCELSITPLSATVESPASAANPAVTAESVAAPLATSPEPTRVTAMPARSATRPGTESASIRVGTDKIDYLINLVGELVITQATLTQYTQDLDRPGFERLLAGVQQLELTTRRLQEAVMSTRMLPIEAVFSRFPRLVHDLAARLGKQLQLQTLGEGTELDKGLVEKIVDPLTHLVRNSIDHGFEMPEQRIAAGKPACGTLTLKAAHQAGQIVIEVSDDGRGLDRARIIDKARANGLSVADNATDAEVWNLIFAPGFSTAEQVSEVSGRGVGMDVVKRNIEALSGQVELHSQPGVGTRVRIRLPLTLAILDGMFVAIGDETLIVPLNAVVESLRPLAGQVKTLAGEGRVIRVRDEYLPLISLRELFGTPGAVLAPEAAIAVIVEAEGRKLALLVDDLLGQQQVVIKSLEAHYRRVHGISGATILGDGRVALIVDCAEILRGMTRALAA